MVAIPNIETPGVLFELTDTQLERLGRFEAGYKLEHVTVQLGSEPLPAVTFVAEDAEIRSGLRPTRAYIDLLIAGACEHDLTEEHVRRLRSIEVVEAVGE